MEDVGAFFLGQRYLVKAGKKRGQLLSKWGTIQRWVEEVLWRTSVEDLETSLMLDKLNEMSNGKEDVDADARVTRKSQLERNDCCGLATVNCFRRS